MNDSPRSHILTRGVIVPEYKSAPNIWQTLDSLLQQSCLLNEILVVNGDTTDEAVSIIEKFGTPIRSLIRKHAYNPGFLRYCLFGYGIASFRKSGPLRFLLRKGFF
jgi:glycosyltransferase involved in cell wall biosynthesis